MVALGLWAPSCCACEKATPPGSRQTTPPPSTQKRVGCGGGVLLLVQLGRLVGDAGHLVSAPSGTRGVAGEMPVRQRRRACVGRRGPTPPDCGSSAAIALARCPPPAGRASGRQGCGERCSAARHDPRRRLGSLANRLSAGRSGGLEAQSVDEDRDHPPALVDVRLSDRPTQIGDGEEELVGADRGSDVA